jgi:hypothetical protein
MYWHSNDAVPQDNGIRVIWMFSEEGPSRVMAE